MTTRRITLLAVGIALFTVLSLCLQVPVFENYYLCLGYTVMAVYCYSFGTLSGTAVGFFGVIAYCVVISGLRGMPGWSLGNIVIGLALGECYKRTRALRSGVLRETIRAVVIVASTALGILAVKSLTESALYMQPFLVRVGKNTSAFVADAAVLLFAEPLCLALDRPARKILPELCVKE